MAPADRATSQPSERQAAPVVSSGRPVAGSLDTLPPTGFRLQASLVFAFFGTWFALLPATQITLALKVDQIDPDGKAATLSLVLGVGSFIALIAQYVFGALSDRTVGRFGMRRPWLLGGMVTGVLSLFLLSGADTVPLLVLAWSLTQLTFNVLLAGLNPVIPDQVPRRQLGRVSGWVGITQSLATVSGAYLVHVFLPDVTMAILVPGAFVVVSIVILLFVLGDRTQTRVEVPPFHLLTFVKGFWRNPRQAPDFTLAWVSRFMVTFGNVTLASYQVFFLIDRFGYTRADIGTAVLQVTLTLTVCTVATSIVVGRISDHLQRRKIFVLISATIVALSHVLAALADDFAMFVVAIAIAGLANGVYLAVDQAVIAEVLPSRATVGKDMGLLHLANVLPQTLVPAVAPLLLAIGASGDNYSALFIGGAIVSIVGAVINQFIRSVR
ncbi:MFS transporter [Frigoribacterium sp. VKM Ac-2836]|uniref:MFS transporter n=1 Tax=Frigoribacterium sp. VKM Ac-2836 TaxID=2739014 RepID=UPI001566B695|nr:MFS transporter [Frigoribacterium sp. VKM Ac-2836]NRD26880.1 MFS transporter [Frigoribacterium sp. VKM Ac-2836]